MFCFCFEGGPGGRNFKRESKDKKYGFGGKKREKGQSDPRSLNDLSAYNPKQGGSGRSRSVSVGNFFADMYVGVWFGARRRSALVVAGSAPSLSRIVVVVAAVVVDYAAHRHEVCQQRQNWCHITLLYGV